MSTDNHKLARRTLLQLVPAGFLAVAAAPAQEHCGSAVIPQPYRFAFFTTEEIHLLDTVMERIIPADEHSPGAHAAKTVEFADLIVSTSPDYVREDWRNALRLLSTELETSSLEAWLDTASQNEDDPQTVLDLFFQSLKHMTINGYYTSAIGIHEDLHYQGNTYVESFIGCEHPEHTDNEPAK
ncbi:MAG: gluconate 2-dehydrogenase subunit 3 family protein [Acidobacteriota bacterium]|nr:gluconate 2-dehydrogenase subunit 3 family protein [Acidobacteriota bacterium]